jgi:hypothetical protein
MPSHPVYGQWLIGYIQDLKRILQQRVCSGFTPDSLFTILPIATGRYGTKNRCKDMKKVCLNKKHP